MGEPSHLSLENGKGDQVDWNDCLCHKDGEIGKLSPFTSISWQTFKKAATIRKDLTYDRMKNMWNDGPKGFYHRKCYQVYTIKKNLQIARKRTAETSPGDKMDVTPRPPKLPRTYDKSKCIICLTDRQSTTNRRKSAKLCQCITAEAVQNMRSAATENGDYSLIKRLDAEYDIFYHKHCFKTLMRSSSVNENQLQGHMFDDSFDKLAQEIDNNIIKASNFVTLSELLCRFIQILKEDGIDAPNYKPSYLQNRIVKRFGDKISFWRSNKTSPCVVYSDSVPKGKLVHSAMAASTSSISVQPSDENSMEQSARDVAVHVYYAAKALRGSLLNSSSSVSWSANGESISENLIDVPTLVYNCLAWVFTEGSSDCAILSTERETTSESIHRRIMSVAQDLIYTVSRGRNKTPKHVSLAVLLKGLTGSAEVVKVVNKFGHCMAYDQLEELETAIAANVINASDNRSVSIPSNIKSGIYSSFCWDNNDILEETLTGMGTTHCTNGIVLQSECDWCQNASEKSEPDVKRKRSLKISTDQHLYHFHSGKRTGPTDELNLQNVNNDDEVNVIAMLKNFCFILTRLSFSDNFFSFCEQDQRVPAWTAFNIFTNTHIPRKNVIGYLPVIDASPTELTTVNTVLKRSIAIADSLDQKDVIIVFDQAIYAKALDIIWQQPQDFDRIVLRMGAFHTACAFLAVIGKRFGDAGFGDLLIEAGVIGSGSLGGVVEGRHYNRAMRIHKLVFEALQRIRWDTFGRWLLKCNSKLCLSSKDEDTTLQQIKQIQNDLSPDSVVALLENESFKHAFQLYNSYSSVDEGPMKTFWNSYIDMVSTLLNFIRATREGNWKLHLSCVRYFLPWFFAYDRHNYARYLSVYWLQMQNLPETHPEAFAHLSNGGFAVQRGSTPFSQIAVDQTIEQTLNRDTKTKGGIIGFSVNKGATHRWFLSAHERAAMINGCRDLAGMNMSLQSTQKDSGKFRIKKDEEDIQNIISTLNSWSNPFEATEQLVCLSSGIVADDKLQTDLLHAYAKGSESCDIFTQQRLISKQTNFHDTLSKLSLLTFSSKNKKILNTSSGKTEMIKADRNLFARLLVIAQSRQLDMKQVLAYELGPVPWSISTISGTLVKTNKSSLSSLLEKDIDPVQLPTQSEVWIFDAMAIIQALNKIPSTFGELAVQVFSYILGISKNAKRIDFVGDSYPVLSIKDLERSNRAASGQVLAFVTRSAQPCPRQWKKFLSLGSNKTSLLKFFVDEWSKGEYLEKLRGIEIYVSHDIYCHKISVDNEKVVTSECTDLCSNQEEADTKMFLHAKHASDQGFSHVVIKSSDTDVEVLACHFQRDIRAKIFLLSGTSARSRVIDVTAVCEKLGVITCKALPGFHAVTGCDTVSAFAGKGKVKAFGILSRSVDFATVLSRLGEDFVTPEDVIKDTERFVCSIYGSSLNDVNELRYSLFCRSKNVQCHQLPPTRDALVKHILRANFQTKVWKSSLECTVSLPSPNRHGWTVKDQSISVHWFDQAPASESLLVLISCSCKAGCTTRRCSCLQQGLSCTEGCKCFEACQNRRDTIDNCTDDENEDQEALGAE